MAEKRAGLEGKPGDRGDAKNRAGIQSIKGGGSPGMPTALKSECSKGYDEVDIGWHGNVKR